MLIVFNAGSSTLKFELFEHEGGLPGPKVAHGALDAHDGLITGEAWLGKEVAIKWNTEALVNRHDKMLTLLLDWVKELGFTLTAAGHRVVHGGPIFHETVKVTPEVIDALKAFIPLAPLHQPHNLSAIEALLRLYPELPQFASFDTAFHANEPELAQWFALPRKFYEQGVRRYGFHGLSYAFIAHKLKQLAPKLYHGKTVIMHLGNGASACAVENGRSIASSMGFTALDGLMMGTRSGQVDPGVLLYCQQHLNMDHAAIETLLYKQSGLLGVSGISSDMRTLRASDAPEAKFAIDLFVYRLVREIGALISVLGGVDGLIFTGGIGEHAAFVRDEVINKLAWLGFELDASKNEANETIITSANSKLPAYVIPTDEARQIAYELGPML
ncbi:acetate/propionate family kinase [Leeia sp. TBRC 13508]|uniref:Acetate kinase n=1 Tax=Leeia speluncae TaxID=2884804 RepID=A0ABS8D882_9NEIS|nr:acetate/propionate family kinase [Leeia speluncae]MCB6184386.1 acetate/propionate family kinase [Leeia speluncae]